MEISSLIHAYAFELTKAARSMPVDLAERQPHIQAIRTSLQKMALRGRINRLTN